MPGVSLQYGLDLTHFRAIIDNPEPMASHIGREVCTGVPRQAVGHRIPTDSEEKPDPDCLGSYAGDVPLVELPEHWVLPSLLFGSTQNWGVFNRTGRVSRYQAGLDPTTKFRPVTYTENLSHDWTRADFHVMTISHVRHEGMPPFSRGNGVPYRTHGSVHTVCLAYPIGCTRTDLSTDHGVYFFVFKEWHHRSQNYGRTSMSEYSQVVPVLCIPMVWHYGQGTTTTTMYIVQLFILHKGLG